MHFITPLYTKSFFSDATHITNKVKLLFSIKLHFTTSVTINLLILKLPDIDGIVLRVILRMEYHSVILFINALIIGIINEFSMLFLLVELEVVVIINYIIIFILILLQLLLNFIFGVAVFSL